MAGTVIDVVNQAGEDMANTMIRSTAFSRALDQVEARARQAVVAETKNNAYTLLTLSVAGGAIAGCCSAAPRAPLPHWAWAGGP